MFMMENRDQVLGSAYKFSSFCSGSISDNSSAEMSAEKCQTRKMTETQKESLVLVYKHNPVT